MVQGSLVGAAVLFVFTSVNVTLHGHNTGWYLPEAAHPYYELEPYVKVEFASLKGPNPPVDLSSVTKYKDDEKKFLKNAKVKNLFKNAKKLSQVKVDDYDAVFVVGGLGPVFDLATSPVNAKVMSEFWQKGKFVSTICHGAAALVGAVDKNGVHIVKGRSFTALSNSEDEEDKKTTEIPFSVQNQLKYHGGIYRKSAKNWEANVFMSVEGRLITGQNPASGPWLGKMILEVIRARRSR